MTLREALSPPGEPASRWYTFVVWCWCLWQRAKLLFTRKPKPWEVPF